MAITLDGVTLPQLLIENEFSRIALTSNVEYTLGGNPIIWESAKTGIPLTLYGGEDWGWITRSTLQTLYTKAAVAKKTYTLIYGANTYTVRFTNENPPVISATPVAEYSEPTDTDYYNNLKIELMTV